MVVSKDSKRKRKESPAVPVQASVVAVESSPEMPKRTKVQAQRKFAQGQNAPASSTYSSLNAASSSSNTGPSTSSESREPPTEILPNKRPKTEDFLTFLCFRGTPELPAHLDFLNQGKTKETSTTAATNAVQKKQKPAPPPKPPKLVKKGKKGRPKGSTKAANAKQIANAAPSQPIVNSSSHETATKSTTRNGTKDANNAPPPESLKAEQETTNETAATVAVAPMGNSKSPPISQFAVRKRAGVINEGNRGGRGRAIAERQLRNATTAAADAAADKCNSSPTEAKRRMCKPMASSGKDVKSDGDDDDNDEEEEEEEEYFSANDESGRHDEVHGGAEEEHHAIGNKTKANAKSPALSERKSETPSKDSEPGKGRGRGGGGKTQTVNRKSNGGGAMASEASDASNAKTNAKTNASSNDTHKEKPAPVKRSRQKESPIFIPSPEPSGRMTRQRAFFEPVKVPQRKEEEEEQQHHDEAEQHPQQAEEPTPLLHTESDVKTATTTSKQPKESKTHALNDEKTPTTMTTTEDNEPHDKSKDLNVFDFSSDDEQPLAKAIRMKRGKASPKKSANARKPGRKPSPKKHADLSGEKKDHQHQQLGSNSNAETPGKATAAAAADKENDKVFTAELNKVKAAAEHEQPQQPEQQLNAQNSAAKNKTKRGRGVKKKANNNNSEQQQHAEEQAEEAVCKELVDQHDVATRKSSLNLRQSRKKARLETHTLNGDGDGGTAAVVDEQHESGGGVSATGPIRTQRPTRKTKEAATIYMGIIGHKLQLGEDEDDDISLNSFPDLPNVKEMEKMENELKKNAAQSASSAKSTTASPTVIKSAAKQQATAAAAATTTAAAAVVVVPETKPTGARRGRPPKAAKQLAAQQQQQQQAAAAPPPLPPLPPKREIEGMLVKKGALTKIQPPIGDNNASAVAAASASATASASVKEKQQQAAPVNKLDSDDEDFLLNEEVNETKRKLEKSFSDSDDEPLAIKVNIKPGDKEGGEHETRTTADFASPHRVATAALTMLPLTTKPVLTPPIGGSVVLNATAAVATNNTSTTNANSHHQQQQQQHHQQQQHQQQLQHNVTTTNVNAIGGTAAGITTTQVACSPFKTIEKKSPVPTSKILNVPATYGTPSTPPGMSVALSGSSFNKTPYLPPTAQQHQQHYHSTAHIRPAHQYTNVAAAAATNAKSPPISAAMPTVAPNASATATNAAAAASAHITAPPLPPQSPLKYQTPPTTYPPPIEAYPSPKINPNFLTPKFDRSLSRSNNFPSPSPVKFDMLTASAAAAAAAAKSAAGLVSNATTTAAAKLPTLAGVNLPNAYATLTTSASTSAAVAAASAAGGAAAAAAAGASASNDPLKDEIGSILAANLMPSKEESGKIFGIASVSLAQSSGPDNTKCTLGKCGSIHKPVLGPVVPTEGYIGDQLSSKERRKAKVNMTHEQIQKWLIECSSNPDEIQDDLDDDFDDNLRPNLSATTPPPTRDDKESTSFSSSSKATRDLGKSESAWSAKGPSLKATPVIANAASRKEEAKLADACQQLDLTVGGDNINDNNKAAAGSSNDKAINLSHKAAAAEVRQNAALLGETTARATATAAAATLTATAREKPERKADKTKKDEKPTNNKANKNDTTAAAGGGGGKFTAAGKQTQMPMAANEAQQQQPSAVELPMAKPGRKKNSATAAAAAASASATHDKHSNSNTAKSALAVTATAAAATPSPSPHAAGTPKTPKRTPVYNQKTQKQMQMQNELKETTTTSHKKAAAAASLSYSAFSVDNEKSIYSFDKDDDNAAVVGNAKLAYRRQSRQDSHTEDTAAPTAPAAASTSLVANSAATARSTPAKRAAAGSDSAAKTKDGAAAASNTSVSLTLSPAENTKLVKVSLETEKAVAAKTSTATSTAAATATPAAAKGSGGNGGSGGGRASKKLEAAASSANDAAAAAADSDSDGHTFYIPLQGIGAGGDTDGGIQGVAVKLGREGPEGPNQKVIMHATLVTKAQMGSNAKPPPASMNVADIVETLVGGAAGPLIGGGGRVAVSAADAKSPPVAGNRKLNAAASTSAAALAAATETHKGANAHARHTKAAMNESAAGGGIGGGGGLVRVNSNSSLLSTSGKSRLGGNNSTSGVITTNVNTSATNTTTTTTTTASLITSKKYKDDTPIKMSNNTAFPRHDDPTQMVEAPIFRPTEKEFADPIEFIERITPIAARFGICKIIPPSTFKPECRISDEMRFTAYNQYVHKMLHRWGPSAKELSAIKKYLATQSIVMNHPPWIGGMEVDLPRLYHTVQELGGLKEVIEKKKWARVAEEMCIPKLAQDRVTKLDDIYCKYLLPYDTLSPAERQKLFDEVEADWAKREARARRNADRFVNTESVSNEEDDVSSEDDEESEEEVDGVSMECIVKGRSMPLSQFYRIARNTMALWFKNTEPTVNEVEAEFWRHVAVRDSHVCVHAGSIDSSGWGYGFPSPGPKGKGSNYARHPWNLKVLTNNPGSVLRSLGPVMGVTVPTLHVGMLFSACCWYRDPHGLSWIEYLHTGASKLWYGIPDDQSANFRAALTALIPTHCQNKTIWLPCDTVMVPPHMLTDRGVSLCRIEQKPGEFIVVFPRAYTSSLATGYVVSESVYFATSAWLDLAKDDFRDIHDSCEPAMFSLEQLLFALGYDQRVTGDAKQQMLPMLNEVFEKETAAREQLKAAGVTSTEKVHNEKGAKAKKQPQPPYKSIESECDLCRANLYISMVKTEDGNNYCLQHALKNLNRGNIQAKQCKLIYAYNVEDIENLIKNLKDKMQTQRRPAVAPKKIK